MFKVLNVIIILQSNHVYFVTSTLLFLYF